MCGIAGWYRRGGKPVEEAVIARQCGTLRHRGPDDSGILIDGDFGFGMRRLSIIDPPGGHQPMMSADRRFAVVFNGEIYNHLEIRQRLAKRGHREFSTRSDTETILTAFMHWGNDAWARLEGMFAVAIWDIEKRELTLVRDQLGIKPLYLSRQRGGLAFASELKGLRPLPGHAFSLNDRAVHDFFSYGHVRRPRSIYTEVVQLDPGHALTIGPTGEPRVERFWCPCLRKVAAKSEEAWIEETREMLLGTVRRHLLADVPVGAFLSGGIDSSGVLAAMRRTSAASFKAFTIGYPGARIDETATARTIADHLGCEHIVLPLDVSDATQVVDEVQKAYDEPFAEMGALPLWLLSRLAAEHVKVVLCGEGSDEIFAGYKRHRNARMIERYRPALDAAAPLMGLAGRLPVTASRRLNHLRQHVQRLTEFVELPDGYQQFFAATQISRRSDRRRLYTPDFWARHEGEDSYARLEQEYAADLAAACPSALDQFLLADLGVAMPSSMLPRLDRASMAHSLEARVPFLSHRLVDWALSMPADLKLRGRTGKYVLRRAIAPWLPPAISRLPKQPLQIPLASWLRGELGSFARDVWNDSGAATSGYLEPRAVESLFREHRAGSADHGRLLYSILIFSLWWRNTSERFGQGSAATT